MKIKPSQEPANPKTFENIVMVQRGVHSNDAEEVSGISLNNSSFGSDYFGFSSREVDDFMLSPQLQFEQGLRFESDGTSSKKQDFSLAAVCHSNAAVRGNFQANTNLATLLSRETPLEERPISEVATDV